MWCCIIGLFSIVLEICGWSFFNSSTEKGGLLGNAPQMAILLCITIPFVYHRNIWIAYGLMAVSLALGEITGAIALMITALLNKDFKIAGAIGAIGLFFIPQIIQAFSIRIPVWGATLLQIAKQPLIGYGPGIFDSVSGQFIKGMYHADNAFSSVLQMVFNCGIGMFIAFMIAVEKVFISKVSVERTVIIVLAVLAFIEYPFEIMKFWFVYAVIIGLFMAKNMEDIEYAG
jgi:hypothetical protein